MADDFKLGPLNHVGVAVGMGDTKGSTVELVDGLGPPYGLPDLLQTHATALA